MTTKKKNGKVVGRIVQEAMVGGAMRQVNVRVLAAVLRRKRLAEKMTWPVFAASMQLGLATLYKLSAGRTKPHQRTVGHVMDLLGDEAAAALLPDEPDAVADREAAE